MTELDSIHGVVLDLDGTVVAEQGLMPGAKEALAVLRGAGIPVCFATNTTRRPRGALADRLRRLGIQVAESDILTAPRAAAHWLRDQGIQSVALHLAEATCAEFIEFRRDDATPEAVVVGDLGDGWTYDRLNLAFKQVMSGAALVAVQKNRYWQGRDGLALDAGPFVAALEYATGRSARLVGKPASGFFAAAARLLDLPGPHILMVGDDVESDVGGAIAAGLQGALVRTGKFRPADLEGAVVPDAVIGSIADLPRLLGYSGPDR